MLGDAPPTRPIDLGRDGSVEKIAAAARVAGLLISLGQVRTLNLKPLTLNPKP